LGTTQTTEVDEEKELGLLDSMNQEKSKLQKYVEKKKKKKFLKKFFNTNEGIQNSPLEEANNHNGNSSKPKGITIGQAIKLVHKWISLSSECGISLKDVAKTQLSRKAKTLFEYQKLIKYDFFWMYNFIA